MKGGMFKHSLEGVLEVLEGQGVLQDLEVGGGVSTLGDLEWGSNGNGGSGQTGENGRGLHLVVWVGFRLNECV
jgi:hypothetical protein